jgi:hypothetical protein
MTRRPPVGEDGISTALVGLPIDQAPSLASSSISFTRSFGYGNADHLRLRICHLVDAAVGPVRAVVLDAAGMSDIYYTGCRRCGIWSASSGSGE